MTSTLLFDMASPGQQLADGSNNPEQTSSPSMYSIWTPRLFNEKFSFCDVVSLDCWLFFISWSWHSKLRGSPLIEFGFPMEPGSKDYCGSLSVHERICHFVVC